MMSKEWYLKRLKEVEENGYRNAAHGVAKLIEKFVPKGGRILDNGRVLAFRLFI